MRIETLAIIFLIIMLPISLVLASYTQNKIETLNTQLVYDSRLISATYDALKAYQINTLNSDMTDYANERMRNINASVNTFFSSIETTFSTLGYTRKTLQNYVPALVFLMYDGYYIYSPYANTIDNETEINEGISEDGTEMYGLKPYIYYSCRYKKGNTDIIITYSLDNYIQIQGLIGDMVVNESGYLLSNVGEPNGGSIEYNGESITEEQALRENVYVEGIEKNLQYVKKNGTKYYLDDDGTTVFSLINGKKIVQSGFDVNEILHNTNAIKYYEEAWKLKKFIKDNGLDELKVENAVDENGNHYDASNSPYQDVGKIFNFEASGSNAIETSNSNFNNHRMDVIKHAIERNLSIAMTNYNNYSAADADFKMPKLLDEDWVKILDNISIISFLQGMSIGGKIYNGYAVITNNKNEDVVMEDSIYVVTNGDNIAHKVTEKNLNTSNIRGIFNMDLERRSAEDNNGHVKYYFPVTSMLSYDSIVTQNNVVPMQGKTLTEYVSNLGDSNLKRVFYTALARERYSLYRVRFNN